MSMEATNRKLQQALQRIKTPSQSRKLSTVFWINDKEKHRKLFEETNGNCCLNHQIGLPTSKIPPHKEMPLFGYELDIIENILKYKDYALNKARGIGATEIILRLTVMFAIQNEIPNRKFLIINGIRAELAKDHIRRLVELCSRISDSILVNASQDVIKIGKSQIIAMPASPAAIRGYENVGAIFADEAAHWNLLDDDPVLEAIEPHRTKSDAHIIIVSTPNGRRGFFAKIFHNPETKYCRDTKPWTVSESLLIDRLEVEKIKNEDVYRYEQEYDCKFLTSKYSAFPAEVLGIAEKNSEEYQLSD